MRNGNAAQGVNIACIYVVGVDDFSIFCWIYRQTRYFKHPRCQVTSFFIYRM